MSLSADLAPARLVRAAPAAAEQARLLVDPPPDFAAAYRRAGQFCRIRVDDVEGIFAMQSAPGAHPLRFLVRVGNPEGGEAADRLAELPDGATIAMGPPAGPGFPLEAARGREVIFVATGTGIAPLCAAIEVVLEARDQYGPLSLIHGLRSEGHLAISDELARWSAAGVAVRLCYSSVDRQGVTRGEVVQDILRARGAALAEAAIVAVGQSAMLASLREELTQLGGSAQRVLTNL